jgi:arginine utilization protein RocB
MKDLKQAYNVTTPAEAFVCWNTLQHRRSGGDVLASALTLAQRAIERIRSKTGSAVDLLTFEALSEGTRNNAYRDLAYLISGRPEFDLPEQASQLMQLAWEQSGRTDPAIVLGFAGVPYPAVSLLDERLEKIISASIAPFGLGRIGFFPGISDMSFLGKSSGPLDVVERNTPHWGTSFRMEEPAGFPCINIGPWGRDYHRKLERLHAPYAFGTLPRVLLAVVEAVSSAR